MGKILLFLISIFALCSSDLCAQEHRCLSHDLHKWKLLNDADYRDRYHSITDGFFANQRNLVVLTDTTVLIPVVVHVIRFNGTTSVTEEHIQSQIDVLNEDYALLNSTSLNIPAIWQPLSKDSKIRFTLAQRDPDGNPTNGITWNDGKKAAYDLFDPSIYSTDSGGHDAWPRSAYLNIWVCPLNGNALGYANYPGSATSNDGIVINPRAFGRYGSAQSPYNLGRTATHEVGHWLSLIHIWGDDPSSSPCSGKDFTNQEVNLGWDDTPNQAQPTFRCKSFPATDECTMTNPGFMYMNYMDYTDDKCMMFFTNGQIRKMRNVLDGIRDSIKQSNGAILPQPYLNDLAIDSVLSPVRSLENRCLQPEIRIRNNGSNIVSSFDIIYGLIGGFRKTYTWTGNLNPGSTTIITLPAIGTNSGHQVIEFRLKTLDENSVNNYRSAGFSNTVLTNDNCIESAFIAYPNPAIGTNYICVKANASESQEATVQLVNNLGQILFDDKRTVNPGDAIQLNMEGMSGGIYFLNVTGDRYNESAKLIYIPAETPAAGVPNCN